MALCKHTLHQGSNPKPVKFVSTASNLCHYTKEHMCLMIQSKSSEKCQKVSLLFRVKEILLLFVRSNNHLFEVHNWYYVSDFSQYVCLSFFFICDEERCQSFHLINYVSGSRRLDTKIQLSVFPVVWALLSHRIVVREYL